MPGGNASHQGSAANVKPNTNAENQLDTAADLAVEPEEIAPPEGAAALRAKEAPENDEATARPGDEQ
ncbi:MAG: hypothetical protein ACFB4I_23160 [Cyanophyceae cyanobacterium]